MELEYEVEFNGVNHVFIVDKQKFDPRKACIPENFIWGADNLPHNIVVEIIAGKPVPDCTYRLIG